MITKYGYKKINHLGLVTIEAWGFETEEEARADANSQRIGGVLEVFKTSHRNYFGKQFKQIACERIN